MGERKDGAGICIWWCRVGERKGGREREEEKEEEVGNAI